MAKIKIMDIAAEMGYSNSEVMKKANELGLNVKVANSSVSEEEAAGIYEYISSGIVPEMFKAKLETKKGAKKATPKKESAETKKPDKESKPSQKEPKKPAAKKETPKEQIMHMMNF